MVAEYQLLSETRFTNNMRKKNYSKNDGRDLSSANIGKILDRKLSTDPNQEYYLYIPLSCGPRAPVFVAVHGITRKAEAQAQFFAPFAEQYGCIMVAPYFSKDRFNGYQRLGLEGKSKRADWALAEIIAEVKTLTDANTEKLYMFGYSGGAQFVSRFAMIYPHRVARIAVAAAGWYTYPDPTLNFPLGIKIIQDHPEIRFDLIKILSIPICVLVGEKDILRDRELRKSRRIDQQQGTNRLERNKRWVKVMRAFTRAHKLKTPYDFRVLPKSGHSFAECMRNGRMGSHVFKFLFPSNVTN